MDPPSTCHPVSPLPSLSALFAQPDWFCWFSPCVPWAVHSGVSDPCGWSLSHFPVEDDLLMCGCSHAQLSLPQASLGLNAMQGIKDHRPSPQRRCHIAIA
eukprot:1161774-Pelagomonas_calceolata.AAC.8